MKVFVAVVMLWAVAYGYDFSDTAFNKILMDDLESSFDTDVFEAPFSPRFRRDAHEEGECKPHMTCCGSHGKPEFTPEEIAIKKQCFKDVTGMDEKPLLGIDSLTCEKIPIIKKAIICTADCIGQKKKAVDEKGVINIDVVREHLLAKFAKDEWEKTLANAIIDKCVPAINAEEKTDEVGCHTSTIKLMHCLWRESQLQCPEDKYKQSPKCMKLKATLMENPKFIPFPPHF